MHPLGPDKDCKYVYTSQTNYLQHKTVSKLLQPEKLEDWKKSSIHSLLLQYFTIFDKKNVRYDVRKIGNFCCCKKRKKLTCWLQNYVNLLNTKAMDHQNLIETDVAIDRQCLAIKTQFRNWSP